MTGKGKGKVKGNTPASTPRRTAKRGTSKDDVKRVRTAAQPVPTTSHTNKSLFLFSLLVAALGVAGYYYLNHHHVDTAPQSRSKRSAIPLKKRSTSLCPKGDACGYGLMNYTTCECSCFASNLATQVGYCLNPDGKCTVVKDLDFETQRFYCPAGSKPSKQDAQLEAISPPTYPLDQEPKGGCLFGKFLSYNDVGGCYCLNHDSVLDPGFGHDFAGRCSVPKFWDVLERLFKLPEISVPSFNHSSTIINNVCQPPTDGCLFGTWDEDTCTCGCIVGNHLSFCHDDVGRCTILARYDFSSKKFMCPDGSVPSLVSGNVHPSLGWYPPNYGCVYGEWNASTGSCNCIRSGSTKEVGYCADSNGRCTVPSVPDANSRFSCPEGSTSTYPSEVLPNVVTTPPVNHNCSKVVDCVFGYYNYTRCACQCIREGNYLEDGYCLDSENRCTIGRVRIQKGSALAPHQMADIYVCPEGSLDSAGAVVPGVTLPNFQGALYGCGYGVLDNLSPPTCRCWNSNDPTKPGYCLDESGECFATKIWNGQTSQFECPPNSTKSIFPNPIAPDQGGITHCLWGTLIDGQCSCIREGFTTEVGFCKDSLGRCTLYSEWDGESKTFKCPSTSKTTIKLADIPIEKTCMGPSRSCGHGRWVGCGCECDGEAYDDGYCKDASGSCNVKKVNGKCPVTLPSVTNCTTGYVEDCGYGSWNPNLCRCGCIGEGSDTTDGYCYSSTTQRCTNRKTYNAGTKKYSCSAFIDAQEAPSAGTTVASAFNLILLFIALFSFVLA